MLEPALALLEFDSIALGIQAGDAMVKRAPVSRIQSGTVHPGRYLVLVAGDVASVEEALKAGQALAQQELRDFVFLPQIHPDVVSALGGERPGRPGDAVGIVETSTVAAAIRAADAGVKGADVGLWQLRLADGLGGKGLVLFTGLVADVEAAVEIGCGRVSDHLIRSVIIAQLHEEMQVNLRLSGRFGETSNWQIF
ncbi:MAG: BMC domain-containing protein [Chloroflexi bacterium]|nr:BMC domain-containing protein [Chloroflexota bacterium]